MTIVIRTARKEELGVWECNEGALAFYEKAGFRTYRRNLELDL